MIFCTLFHVTRSFYLLTAVDGKQCLVYDAVFHPTALRLAATNTRFRDILVVTAFDGIEQRFPAHSLTRETKFPKMKFKVYSYVQSLCSC
jgi:hypothetical protein